MNNGVPEADGSNELRGGGLLTFQDVPKPGDRPVRKKAFWRAFKRKELWAIVAMSKRQMDEGMKNILNQFARVLYEPYCPDDRMYITWPFPNETKPTTED